MIIDLKDGQHISNQFLVGSVSKGTNNMGSQYLNIELRDASGAINGKKWEISPDDESIVMVGNVIHVEGETLKYKDNLQVKILSLRLVAPEDVDTSSFIKAPPIPKEVLISKFEGYIKSITNGDCLKLINYFLVKYKDKIYSYPAGVSVHHEYSSGLLVHITTMLDIAEKLIDIYGDVDRDLLLTGIILHDLGKTKEFEGPVVYKYSLEGKLLGHISIMVGEIKEASDNLKITSEIPLLLQHMVLSHHNEPEFGSPVPPMTKEALMLSLIDNMDSKIVIASKALDVTDVGEFTQRIYALDNRSFYKHK